MKLSTNVSAVLSRSFSTGPFPHVSEVTAVSHSRHFHGQEQYPILLEAFLRNSESAMCRKSLRSPVPKEESGRVRSQVVPPLAVSLLVNLALAMVQKGKRVGILDADIFGPSIPRLLSLSGEPRPNAGNTSFAIAYRRKSTNTPYKLWIKSNVDGISCAS